MDYPEIIKAAEMLRIFKRKSVQSVLKLFLRYDPKPLSATNIYVALKLEQSAVSQTLSTLNKYGFVDTERHGKWIYYKLNKGRIEKAREIAKQFESFTAKAA